MVRPKPASMQPRAAQRRQIRADRKRSQQSDAQSKSPVHLTPPLWMALRRLLKARDAARRLDRPAWDFAVDIRALKEAGLDDDDLRSLICQNLVEHGVETTPLRGPHRTFRRSAGLRLTAASCFVLSEKGLAASQHDISAVSAVPVSATLPVWDSVRRELRVGDLVVKQLKRAARCQETIILAFAEQHWVNEIDDPLPPIDGIRRKDHLHDTIGNLNRGQRIRLVRFYGDGWGRRVGWRWRVHGE